MQMTCCFSFPPSDQQLISVNSYLINSVRGLMFVLFFLLDLCCSEHIESPARTFGALVFHNQEMAKKKVYVKALKRRKYSLDHLIVTFGEMCLAHIFALIQALIGFVIRWN